MLTRNISPVVLCAAVLAISPTPTQACTILVASGKATADGRPLLWKNREAPERDNKVVRSESGKFSYVAVVNAADEHRIWAGTNSAGFAIANSVVYDLPRGSTTGPGNGKFMRDALETCQTVADFERLLEQTNQSGRRTQANFGVIDATGAACIYETGHRTFTRFDVNDPGTAPDGYLVRTNFSVTGTFEEKLERDRLEKVYSGHRYLRVARLSRELFREDKLRPQTLLRNFARDLADESGRAYAETVNAAGAGPALPERICTKQTVNRSNTMSAAVVHGVRAGEDTRLTTMWTILGEPIFSIAVPCWPDEGVSSVLCGEQNKSPLCSLAAELRAENYADKQTLRTEQLPTIWSTTLPTEDKIFSKTKDALARWREEGVDVEERRTLHETFARQALQTLTGALNATATVDLVD